MKKVYALALLCIPLCLILGFGTPQPNGETQEQEEQEELEQQVWGPMYHRETDSTSMAGTGKLLEELGKEIQKNSSVTVGGNTYPITGLGGFQISVLQRPERDTAIQIEIYSGQTEPPTKGRTYVSYARFGRRGTPSEFAKLVAEVGKTLASTGAFVMEDHKVALEGTAKVVQRLTESTRQFGRQWPYTFYLDAVFGEKDFPLPEDEEDTVEAEKRGDIKELAKQEITGADQKEIGKLFDSLSNDLNAGKVRLGDKDLEVGENIGYGLSHLVATDGKSNRIRIGFRFGEVPPRRRPTGPKYSEEFFDAPMKKVGALLKRMGTEILEVGTFKLGEDEFSAKKMATYEVKADERGFSIELRYIEPPKEK